MPLAASAGCDSMTGSNKDHGSVTVHPVSSGNNVGLKAHLVTSQSRLVTRFKRWSSVRKGCASKEWCDDGETHCVSRSEVKKECEYESNVKMKRGGCSERKWVAGQVCILPRFIYLCYGSIVTWPWCRCRTGLFREHTGLQAVQRARALRRPRRVKPIDLHNYVSLESMYVLFAGRN